MFLKPIAYLAIILFLSACATGHQQTSVRLREYVTTGEYSEAVAYLKQSPLALDKNSKLLYFTELGLLEHYRGDLNASIEALNSAKILIEELYTTRVSGKINSFMSNDNADFYYGEKYEASLVYFYLSLNYYMQATKEKDAGKKKILLGNARSEVVAWDSFLTEIKNERLGEALFKEDILAKTFGALVHESQGTVVDNQIALQLYKDAQIVFFKNYNLFPTFNASYETFRKNFELLPTLSTDEVVGKYVLATEHGNAFNDFLNYKIQNMTNRLLKKNNNEGSISFLIQDGLIAQKVPQKHEFPMVWGGHQSMAFTMGMSDTISFELPGIQQVERLESSRLQALSKEGVVLFESPLSIIAPLSELAQQAINEHSAAIATKTAARVATKHISALLASMATYEAGRQRNDGMMMLFATAGHAAAVAGINASEKADVRFWSTLPSNIRMGHIMVPKGVYKFRAVFGQPTAQEYRVIELGEHEVSQDTEKFVMNNKELPVDEKVVAENPGKKPERTISSEP